MPGILGSFHHDREFFREARERWLAGENFAAVLCDFLAVYRATRMPSELRLPDWIDTERISAALTTTETSITSGSSSENS
jgi:hypothetical protein